MRHISAEKKTELGARYAPLLLPVAAVAVARLRRRLCVLPPVLRQRTADIVDLDEPPLRLPPHETLVPLVRLDQLSFACHVEVPFTGIFCSGGAEEAV